jgi:GNAT superfamily N-acetyltransferase
MIIRESKPEDIKDIIELLKLSLGESKLKKSKTVWNFKHLENPFGASPVLLAEEDYKLIGVRAFMQWRWQLKDVIWTSYRAVDTATHPDFQGKGIFKTLTLKALTHVKSIGECFVFNTPNDQSRPGYLKMGWHEVDKIKVALTPTFFNIFSLFSNKKIEKKNMSTAELENLCIIHNTHLAQKNKLFTPKSTQYLKWRYENNPLQDYFVVSTIGFYTAMYVKKHRFFNELRVVETIGDFEIDNQKFIRHVIVNYALKNRCWFISMANKNLFRFRLYGKFGPKLTVIPLTKSNKFTEKVLGIENWHYTLGDLELF